MNVKEFLKNKNVFYEVNVEEDNTTEIRHKVFDLMEEWKNMLN
jgi:hypothetical protein